MQDVIKDLEARMQAATDLLAREFSGVRTGRASAALLDNVRVEAYGNLTPINQLATVSVPDSRTIVIQPWDASQMKEIEKVTYIEVLNQGLGVMDTTAISLCMDNKLPIVVFDLTRRGNIRRIVTGEPVGSVVSADVSAPKG